MAGPFYQHADIAFRKDLAEQHKGLTGPLDKGSLTMYWPQSTHNVPATGRPRCIDGGHVLQPPMGLENIHGHCYLVLAFTTLLSIEGLVNLTFRHSCSDNCISCAFSRFARTYHSPTRSREEVEHAARTFHEETELLFWGPRAAKFPNSRRNYFKPGGDPRKFVSLFLHHIRQSIAKDPVQSQQFDSLFSTDIEVVYRCSACSNTEYYGSHHHLTILEDEASDPAAFAQLVTKQLLDVGDPPSTCSLCKSFGTVIKSAKLINLPEYLLFAPLGKSRAGLEFRGSLCLELSGQSQSYVLKGAMMTIPLHGTALTRTSDGLIHWTDNNRDRIVGRGWNEAEAFRRDFSDKMGKPDLLLYQRSQTKFHLARAYDNLTLQMPPYPSDGTITCLSFNDPTIMRKVDLLELRFKLPRGDLERLLEQCDFSLQRAVDSLAYGIRDDITLDEVPAAYQADTLLLYTQFPWARVRDISGLLRKHKFQRSRVADILRNRDAAQISSGFIKHIGSDAQLATRFAIREDEDHRVGQGTKALNDYIVDGSIKYKVQGIEYSGHYTTVLRPTMFSETAHVPTMAPTPSEGWLENVSQDSMRSSNVRSGLSPFDTQHQPWDHCAEVLNSVIKRRDATFDFQSTQFQQAPTYSLPGKNTWAVSRLQTVSRHNKHTQNVRVRSSSKRPISDVEDAENGRAQAKRVILDFSRSPPVPLWIPEAWQVFEASHTRTLRERGVPDEAIYRKVLRLWEAAPEELRAPWRRMHLDQVHDYYSGMAALARHEPRWAFAVPHNSSFKSKKKLLRSAAREGEAKPFDYIAYRRQQAFYWLPCLLEQDLSPQWTTAVFRPERLLLNLQRFESWPTTKGRVPLMVMPLESNMEALLLVRSRATRLRSWVSYSFQDHPQAGIRLATIRAAYKIQFPNTEARISLEDLVNAVQSVFPNATISKTTGRVERLQPRLIPGGQVSMPPSPWPGAVTQTRVVRSDASSVNELIARMSELNIANVTPEEPALNPGQRTRQAALVRSVRPSLLNVKTSPLKHMDLTKKDSMTVAVRTFLKSLKQKRKSQVKQVNVDDLNECFAHLFGNTDLDALPAKDRRTTERPSNSSNGGDEDDAAAAWKLFEQAVHDLVRQHGGDPARWNSDDFTQHLNELRHARKFSWL